MDEKHHIGASNSRSAFQPVYALQYVAGMQWTLANYNILGCVLHCMVDQFGTVEIRHAKPCFNAGLVWTSN
jgi:hypothetical protein